ncbi:MAG: extracellular solute-binding protein [Atribacterota bacterium]|nr:extracellular solute-binding protein [Atribacterota bacterium]
MGKWKAIHLPKGPAGIKSNIWAWSIAMNAASQHKKAAWLFMEWASSKPVMLVASAKYNNQTPVRNSVWNDPQIVERTSAWGQGTCRPVVSKNLEEYAALRWTPNPNAFTLSEMWQEHLQKVWSQEMTADAAIKEVHNRAKRLAPPKEWLKK